MELFTVLLTKMLLDKHSNTLYPIENQQPINQWCKTCYKWYNIYSYKLPTGYFQVEHASWSSYFLDRILLSAHSKNICGLQ